jgi:hypothetical protein
MSDVQWGVRWDGTGGFVTPQASRADAERIVALYRNRECSLVRRILPAWAPVPQPTEPDAWPESFAAESLPAPCSEMCGWCGENMPTQPRDPS